MAHAGHAGRDHSTHGEHSEHAAHSAHAGHDHAAHAAHADHSAHAGHGDHHGHHGPATWKMAALATLHCLTGCAIGEVLGLVIGTGAGMGNGSTIVLSIVLAFVFGYGLTLWGIRGAGLGLGGMVKIALAADTVSIVVMEIIDNGFMMFYPGAMDAGLGDALFWGSLVAALILAFLVTTPVNKALISAGKGHAVVHGMH
ncbi:DUF4396 domain-containing protein [Yinghuangia seranimata]|uniref:DUF4396 domain-containing protein n=1 Tax=Yinghuangia seranimata TaxID=408067 RepID=UPI00248C024B|nr:DUF4396 domain-containing protein [Yinghuangia seranimata]MDI2126050.1 DUF4396 domain-containing protein [Yinghuangia seranimata]